MVEKIGEYFIWIQFIIYMVVKIGMKDMFNGLKNL